MPELAAQLGRVACVRLLLDAGEDPDRYSPTDAHAHSTPLHQAISRGHQDIVELLLSCSSSAARAAIRRTASIT